MILNFLAIDMHQKIIRIVAYINIVVCSLTVIGWVFDINILKSFIDGTAPMKLNSAITFILLSASMLALRKDGRSSPLHIGLVIASFIIPFLTILQYMFAFDFGIDQAFYKDSYSGSFGLYPGRISQAGSLSFMTIGICVLMARSKSLQLRILSQCGFNLVTLTGCIAFIGYVYRVPIFYKLSTFSSMAVHTSILLVMTSIGASFMNPSLGLTGLFTGKGMGNTMARSLIPMVFLILLVLGFLRLESHRHVLVSVEFGIALFTTSFLMVILFLVAITAAQLNKLDAKRLLVEESYIELNKNLEGKIVERTTQLKEIQERFEMATHSAQIGIWEIDLHTKQLFGNAFFYKSMALYEEKSMTEEKLYSNILSEDQVLLKRKIEEIVAGQDAEAQFVCRVRCPQGALYFVKMMFAVKKDALGVPQRVYGASIDITQQIKFEEELQQQYGRIKAFIREAPIALSMLDTEFKFMAVSDFWFKDYPSKESSILGVHFREILPNVWAKFKDQFEGCLKGEIHKSDAEKVYIDDDRECWVRYVLAPWYDNSGVVGGVMVKLMDITIQKNQEIELTEAKERLALAAETSGVAVYEWDFSNNHLYGDDIMRKMYAFEKMPPEKSFELIRNVIHKDEIEDLLEYVGNVMANPNAHKIDAEYRIVWPDGSIHHIRSKGTIMRDAEGKALKMVGTNVDVTLQKTVEQQLTKGYQTIKTFIEGAPSAIAMLDNNLRYLAVSNQWLKDYKPGMPNIIGYSHYEVFPEISDYWKALHQACLRGETVKSEGERFVRADGSEQWVKYVICPWYEVGGEVGGIIMHTSDITEQRKSVEELMHTKERLQMATEASKVGIWDWDIKNDILYWDDHMYKLYGLVLNKELSLKGKWEHSLHTDDKQRVKSELSMALKGHMDFDTEFKIIWPNGIVRHIKAKAVVQRDEKDQAIRMVGTNLDITQQKVQLETLRQSEERYFKMVNEVQDYAIVLLDKQGKIENWNFGAQKIFDYSAVEIVGSGLDVFFTPEELQEDKVGRLFREALEYGRAQDEGWRLKRNGNIFLGSTTLTALHGMQDEIIGYSMLTHDLTERKKAELSEKMEAKNKELEQITYIASHDLQEPLRTISGIVNIMNLQYENQLDEEADKYLKFMKEASERMRNLIKGLLDYSRIGKGNEVNYFDSGEVMEEVKQDLSAFITESHAKLIIVGNLPYLKGYRTEFRLLLQNLISNAVKFRKKDVDPEITISAVKENNCWKFALKDNGIGIDPKYQEKIFMIFQRLHNRSEYEGTGIGLSHCKKIVELHGGRIWVDSYLDEGSTFYFTIPI